ncbi:MAG: hypothetical protein H7A35_00090 [Planctomycetales bacterium]|nr:hypothetical protein [bacterium]UNM08465.1 MAG: hypothetical protein H7A35_00090 [Planctomycetales bacterium]
MPDHTREQALVPIVIGVSGHRYLGADSIDALERVLRREIQAILHAHPHSPVMLLTALAIGADFLAARVGLSMERVSVVAPLPMPLEEYRRDFTDPGALAEFNELLGQVDHWFELPMQLAGRQLDPTDHTERQFCYSALAEYIARYSHYGIVLWDGEGSRGPGSTAEFVNIVLHGVADLEDTRGSIQEPASAGPVLHILAPRENTAGIAAPEPPVRWMYPDRDRDDREEQRIYSQTLGNIELYNRDIHLQWELVGARMTTLAGWLGCPPILEEDRALGLLRWRFAAADGLAVLFKTRHIRDLVMLLILSGVGYTCLELYDEAFSSYSWGALVLVGFPLGMLLALLRLRNSRISHSRYLNYRALAEGMRVQYYWQIAGLEDEVHDYYLNKHQSELRWIRWAVQAWLVPLHERQVQPQPAGEAELQARQQFVNEAWVTSQRNFYAGRARKRESDSHRLERWRTVLFSLAVLGSLFLIGVHYWCFNSRVDDGLTGDILSRCILLVAMLFVLGGLISHYTEKVSYEDEQLQYQRASDMFREGGKQIERLLKSADTQRAGGLFREIGMEALQENGDWVEMHSHRAPDLPAS